MRISDWSSDVCSSDLEREESESLLKDNRVKALIATSALGMGFDKPDLGFVVHVGAPSSQVSYYQQVGRAGCATASADVLLLPGAADRDIWHYFAPARSAEHTSELQTIMRISSHVLCSKNKIKRDTIYNQNTP